MENLSLIITVICCSLVPVVVVIFYKRDKNGNSK